MSDRTQPRMSALALRHFVRLLRKMPVDQRDERGRQLKRDGIRELLRLAERRSTRPVASEGGSNAQP